MHVIVAEDIVIDDFEDEEHLNDSDISVKDVLKATHHEPMPSKKKNQMASCLNGDLVIMAAAEMLEEVPNLAESDGVNKDLKGKQKRMANCLYNLTGITSLTS
jgi:hypothetical protein